MARTIIGESADQPPIGQAAVAHVVMNRLNAGKYGDTPSQVILKPNAFEPWKTRTQELATIPRTSPEYQTALAIAKGVASGDIPDPTQGATHFANVDTVKSRGNNKAMGWINGMQNVTKIGDHTFGNADGPPQSSAFNNEQPPQDFLGAFIKQKGIVEQPASSSAQSDTPDYLSAFAKAKVGDSKPLPPEGYYDGRLHINISKPSVPFYVQDAAGNEIALHEGDPRYPIANQNPSMIPQIAKDYVGRLNELADQNATMFGEGASDISQGKVATGTAKAGLGALGYIFSPASAIDKPIENITGNKNLGAISSLMVPGAPLGKVANASRPAVSALSDIIKDVGAENIPSIVSRLESNPKLTLMDVAPTVRGNAAGLATDPRNVPAMNQLNQFQQIRMADRSGDAVNIFEDALGKTPNMAKTIDDLKQQSVDVGKKVIQPAVENAAPIPVKSLTAPIDRMIGSSEAIAGETPRIPLDPTQIRLLQLRKQITSGEVAPLNERVKFSIDPINEAIKSGKMSADRMADFTEARRLLNSARRGSTSEEDLLSGLKELANKQKIVGPIDDAVKMITKGPTEYRSAEFVHGLQSRLREEASNLSKSATGSDRNMGSSLHDARDKLVDQIDKASGGAYRPGLKQYAESKAVDEAFKEGFSVFSNPTGAEGMIANHPDMWKKWMEGASDTEKRAVAQGILFGANNKIMNTRRGLDVPENSYAHERISSVVGKPNADEIVRRLGDWRDIAETDNLLTKNSATAVRQAGQVARSVRDARSGHDILQSLMPAAVVGGAAHLASGGSGLLSAIAAGTAIGAGKAANYAGKAHDLASNKAYAQWASATGSKKDDLISALRAMAEKQNPGNRLSTSSILQALPR